MRPRLQLIASLLWCGCAARAQLPDAASGPRHLRVCQADCVLIASPGAGSDGPCPPAPPDDQLERALRSGAAELRLDACRVVRRLASSSSSQCALLEVSSRPRYLEERGRDFVRECIAGPDGTFQTEHLERFTDAGWQSRSDTFGAADGGAALRVTTTALRFGKTRLVREAWRDGGWQVDSEVVEASPGVLPIQR